MSEQVGTWRCWELHGNRAARVPGGAVRIGEGGHAFHSVQTNRLWFCLIIIEPCKK